MNKILVVDDSKQNRCLLETLLKRHGYEVILATDGAEALKAARSNPPNMVITDILMPGMDGYALCRHWKRDKELTKIPLVFYTAAYTDPKDRQLGLSMGAERFITKPQEHKVFLGMIAEIIEAYKTGRLTASAEPVLEEMVKEYNDTLIRKLEEEVRLLESNKVALDREIAERKHTEEALQLAFDQIKTLHGIIPICMHCKKIRDDAGYWSQVEVYVRDRTDAEFSHGICPECLKTLYPKDAYDIPDDAEVGRHYRAIVDEIPALLCRFKVDGVITYVNEHRCRYFGGQYKQFVGTSVFDSILDLDCDMVRKKLESLTVENPIDSHEHRVVVADGSVQWQRWTNHAIFDANGIILEYQSIGEDITERKRMEAKLERTLAQSKQLAIEAQAANLAKSKFLSSMSHEIRTPMNAILGYSQLMQRDKRLTAQQSEYLGTISRSGVHLLALINDILEMSKIESGRIELNPVTFDLHAMLHDMEMMFRLRMDAKRLRLEIQTPAVIPAQAGIQDESISKKRAPDSLDSRLRGNDGGGLDSRLRGNDGGGLDSRLRGNDGGGLDSRLRELPKTDSSMR